VSCACKHALLEDADFLQSADAAWELRAKRNSWREFHRWTALRVAWCVKQAGSPEALGQWPAGRGARCAVDTVITLSERRLRWLRLVRVGRVR
jgi:hypothetical protein